MSRREASIRPADDVLARLSAVMHRLITLDVLRAVSAGAALAALTLLVLAMAARSLRAGLLPAVLAGLSVVLVLMFRRRHRWTSADAARAVERTRPESRNVVVTAEELLRDPAACRESVRNRVFADAASAITLVQPAEAIPLRGASILCAAALLALAGTWVGLSSRTGAAIRETAANLKETVIGMSRDGPRVRATITPPSYLRSTAQSHDDPERIEAVAGSRLVLRIEGSDQPWRTRLGATPLQPHRRGDGVEVEVELSESSYLAIEGGSSTADAPRLIPVIVTPDRAPTIVVDKPGKDLLFPDSSAGIPISATATDDFGLRSLELRFTRVSGSGEQFSFEEGVLPLQLDRNSDRSWRGRVSLALAAMDLDPGDAVVYRVVGADARPGQAGVASSDTFFVEIAAPDQVTPAGFELPPDRERYALSQQMIVLKIERLRARERTISREAVSEEAAAIAAEQRAVRANFIFLTGGHVEDEEEEAEHSHEIQEGRLEHSARKEISAAIQHMSRAEQALIAPATGAALLQARAAVEALQRAFGRNRYFMRTLPSRSRIDPSRRLAGELDRAASSRRRPEPAVTSTAVLAARQLLVELLEVGALLNERPGSIDSGRIASMAERALAVDAGSQTWQEIAGAFLDVGDALAAGRSAEDVQAHLKQALDGLQSEARREAVPPAAPDERNRALRGAWSALRGSR